MEIMMVALVVVAVLMLVVCAGMMILYLLSGKSQSSDEAETAEVEVEDPTDERTEPSVIVSAMVTIDPLTGYVLDDDEVTTESIPLPGERRIVLGLSSCTKSLLKMTDLRHYAEALKDLAGNCSVQCLILEGEELVPVSGAELYSTLIGNGDFSSRIAMIDQLRADDRREPDTSSSISEEPTDEPEADAEEEMSQDTDSEDEPTADSEPREEFAMAGHVTMAAGSYMLTDVPVDEPVRDTAERAESDSEAPAEELESDAVLDTSVEKPEAELASDEQSEEEQERCSDDTDDMTRAAEQAVKNAEAVARADARATALLDAVVKVGDDVQSSAEAAATKSAIRALTMNDLNPVVSLAVSASDESWEGTTPIPRLIVEPVEQPVTAVPVPPKGFDPNKGL